MKKIILTTILIIFAVSCLAQTNILTLEQCKEMALENNQDLEIARIDFLTASEEFKQSKSDRLPSAAFKGSLRYQSVVPELEIPPVNTGFGPPITVFDKPMTLGSKDTYDFNMTVSQPLFTGFQLKNRAKVMDQVATSKKMDYKRRQSELIYQVEFAYRNLQKAQMFIEISMTAKEQVEAHLFDVRKFFEQGLVRKDEVMQVQVKLSEAELSIVQAEHAFANAAAYLENITGEDLGDIVITDKVSVDSVQPVDLGVSLDAAYSNRLEFQSLASLKQAAMSSVDAAKGAYMPTVAAFATLGYGKPGLDFVNNEWMDYWVAGVGMEWDLWNWGKTSSRTQTAKLRVKKIDESLDKLKNAINLDVTQSGLKVKETEKRLTLLKQIVEQSDETYRIVENNFKQGMTNNSDFLDVQLDLTRAKLQLAQAQVDYLTAIANLKRAEGTNLNVE